MFHTQFTYTRAALGLHLARLRVALRDRDRGASAVELAFITVGLLVIAGIIVLAIKTFVKNASNNIQNTTP
jgi:Flp pilus assembly protein TadG